MTRRIAFAVMVLALVVTLPVAASTFVAMDQQELVAASDAVVEGHVLTTHSFWNADGTAILTEAVVQVVDTVVGDAPAVVHVRTFGGQVDDYKIEAHGFPTFQDGDHVLLFLHRDRVDSSLRITGYQLGQYSIRADADGQQKAFPGLENGVQLLTMDGTPAPRPEVLPLDVLKNQIRTRAGQDGPRRVVK